jgi:hypothetical protein
LLRLPLVHSCRADDDGDDDGGDGNGGGDELPKSGGKEPASAKSAGSGKGKGAEDEDGDDDDDDADDNDEGDKMADAMVSQRSEALIKGSRSVATFLAAEVFGDAANAEGFFSEAERLLRKASEGLEATCSFMHHDTLRCFAKHQKVGALSFYLERAPFSVNNNNHHHHHHHHLFWSDLPPPPPFFFVVVACLGLAKVSARLGELEARKDLERLSGIYEKQRDEGAWIAAEETKLRIDVLKGTSGAAAAAERMWGRIEAVKKRAGPGHVGVGRLQCALADAVSTFPNSTWVRKNGTVRTAQE